MIKNNLQIHIFAKTFIVLLLSALSSESYSHDPLNCIGGKVLKCVCPEGTVLKDAECRPTFKNCFKTCLSCVENVCQWRNIGEPKYTPRTACRTQRHAQCMTDRGFNNPSAGCGAYCDWTTRDPSCSHTTCAANHSPDPGDHCKCKQREGGEPAENSSNESRPTFKNCFKTCLSCVENVCQWRNIGEPKYTPRTACRTQRHAQCMTDRGFNNPSAGCGAYCDWTTRDPSCSHTTCAANHSPDPGDHCKCKQRGEGASRGVR